MVAPDPLNDAPPAGYYRVQKVVYQNDSGWAGDRGYFERLLRNLKAHIAATDGKVEIRVVSFSAGVRFFQAAKTDAELAGSLYTLRYRESVSSYAATRSKGWLCALEDLYGVQAADIVPSGVAEIARLQGMGFVYVYP